MKIIEISLYHQKNITNVAMECILAHEHIFLELSLTIIVVVGVLVFSFNGVLVVHCFREFLF